MDFWASLEHKIFYKYNKDIPQKLIDELREAAIITAQLEKRMEILNNEIERIKQINSTDNKNR